MLDIAQVHPVVEDIWNFFPFQYIFPYFVRVIGNFVLFIPNIFLRILWLIWNTIFTVPNILLSVATMFLNA